MRTLFLDCFSGISGDMTVGALCDLGVKPSTFEWELSKLDLGDFHMHFERKKRQNVEGVKFGIHGGAVHTHDQDEDPDEHGQVHAHGHSHEHEHEHEHEHPHAHGDEEHLPEHEHQHAHAHADEEHLHAPEDEHSHGEEHEHAHSHAVEHEHAHSHGEEHDHSAEHAGAPGRSYVEIRAMLEKSDLSDFVKKHALGIFRRVAVAEAKVHGTAVEKIGFHEVGALDSIADIVCACVGLEELGVERVCASPLTNGRGWVDCAHGRFPIPAFATLEILQGIPVAQIDEPHEFITPTGAAILAEFATQFGPMPTLRVEKIGYGLGLRQLASRPNVLRAVLGEIDDAPNHATEATSRYATDTITQLETNLDDVSAEIIGSLMERLLQAGALDVFLTPVQMKKNRPGVLLTVLCQPVAAKTLADMIFTESSAFGLRLSEKPRLKLERRSELVTTEYGEVSVKLGFDRAGRLLQVAPEFESCRAAAAQSGQAVRTIYAAALQAQAAGDTAASEKVHTDPSGETDA